LPRLLEEERLRVYLPRVGSNKWTDLKVEEFEALASRDRFRTHQLVNDPEMADVVLFVQCHMVDWRLNAIIEHPVAASHWPRVFVYDERDRPWRSFPGIYVSSPRFSFDRERQRAWSYLRVPQVLRTNQASEPDLLFSFVGSRTARCRTAVLALEHPDALVAEVTDFMFWNAASLDFAGKRQDYAEAIARSRFVLCPRGRGTSTFRLYEAVAAGRVPVVISDEWVPPVGPPWDAFSIQVAEDDVDDIPDLLEARAGEWPEMSAAARAAFNEFFSDDVTFHRIVSEIGILCHANPSWPGRRAMKRRAMAASLREKARRIIARAG
jgi:hypothetical protein